jgi:CoA:oxalate CoA-transferase
MYIAEVKMASALEGIKILDFSVAYAGPFCTLLLRDLGAEVIKVERMADDGGEGPRTNFPHTKANESGAFINLNRGKKCLTLNVKNEKARDIIQALTAKVDVLIENFSPGTMDRLGLGSQDLCKINPGLIYTSISGFGHNGPRQNDVSFDPVAQAMGGLMSVTGFPENPPTKVGVPLADLMTGIFTAVAILAALQHRSKTGEGQSIDMSLQDCVFLPTAIWCGPLYFLEGKVPQRYGNGDAWTTTSDCYPAKDGYVYIAAPLLGQTHRVFQTMGREDLINSPLGAQGNERLKYRDEIGSLISGWTKSKTVEEILDSLKKADVPCSAVPNFDQVCKDPQILSREMIIEVEQLLSGKVKVPGSVFKMSKTPGNIKYPCHFLGQDNNEILSEILGYSQRDIDQLTKEGII